MSVHPSQVQLTPPPPPKHAVVKNPKSLFFAGRQRPGFTPMDCTVYEMLSGCQLTEDEIGGVHKAMGNFEDNIKM